MTEEAWLPQISESFGLIFLLERKLEYICDKVLAPHKLTTKQWLVLAAIERLCEAEPSIQEVAKQLATSHQNVKAIALNLQKSGFVSLEKDSKDKRVTRLTTTAKSKEFWQAREDADKELLLELFNQLTSAEKLALHQSLVKLFQGACQLEERINAMGRTISE